MEFPGTDVQEKLVWCEIFMGLGFWPWGVTQFPHNFQGVSHNFAEFPELKVCFLWDF